jgi:tRNA (pseudouridine54-N1)-methyltransferase
MRTFIVVGHKAVTTPDFSLEDHLNPDERTTAALLKKALAIAAEPEWTRSTPGIFVRSGGLAELLLDLKDAKLFYLREDGTDACSGEGLAGDAVFILGDHLGMTEEEESLIERAGSDRISVGPVSLHADHCIVLINWLLDTTS